jgi:hypothetical protein
MMMIVGTDRSPHQAGVSLFLTQLEIDDHNVGLLPALLPGFGKRRHLIDLEALGHQVTGPFPAQLGVFVGEEDLRQSHGSVFL